MLARTISKLTTKLTLFIGTSLALVAGGVVTFVTHTNTLLPQPQPPTRVKLHTNHKTIKFSDAISLGTPALEQSALSLLTLVAADFDEDGTQDLLSGAGKAGTGFLSFYRGNVEAIYPTQNTAKNASPFFPASQFATLPITPDFLVVGDFNADGHADVATAARNDSALYLLAGDGQGRFAEAVAMGLNGEVTGLAAGEINRVDGLADLAVALNSPAGASVLLLTGAEGAWTAQPQTFALAQTATSLEFAHLTRDGLSDLAVAAGNELVVFEGGQQAPRMTRTRLSFVTDALAVGRFTSTTQEQIALLARDGSLSVASYQRATERRASNRSRANSGWQVVSYVSDASARSENASSRQLLRTRVSASKHDDLLTLHGNQLQFVTNADAPQRAATMLEGALDLVAALPLRTNASALQGLALLSRNEAAPLLVQPVPEATFTVNSPGDAPDLNPGDGVCASISTAGPPACTFRAAIQEAEASAGADTITFNLGAGAQTIFINSSLPQITTSMVIDGTPQGGAPATQTITLSAGPNFADRLGVIVINGSNVTVRGLTINNFPVAAVVVTNGGNNRIEGNTLVNNLLGVWLTEATDNTVGGRVAAARNVIGESSGAGVLIEEEISTGNLVLGNYIGVDATGTNGIGNNFGVFIDLAMNNFIGDSTAGSRNVISGNISEGIRVNGDIALGFAPEAADGNVIQQNYIGVDATGATALGNGVASEGASSGITIIGASNTTIGGLNALVAGNVIANNGLDGVTVAPRAFTGAQLPLNNAIQGNSIINNGALGIDLDTDGVNTNDPGDGDTGANNLQNYPILTAALTRATGTTVTGTLNSTANSTFAIELFSNTACDTSGNGEGETYLTRTTVTTNAAGLANFSVATGLVPVGRFITATATDANGNTSEFSACRAVQNAAADLVVTQTVTPNPVNVGNNLVFNLTVTNAGPDDATGVTLTNTISIPNGQFTVVSVTPSQGTCTGINCSLGTILSTANATVSIVIAPTIPTAGTPPNSVTATNIATVISNEQDPATANNISTASATVNASADLAITQAVTPNPAASGSIVTYTITITNNGPSTASNVSGRFDPSLLLNNVTCTAPAGSSCNRDGNPFFTFTPNLAPGTAVFTLRGTLGCLGQDATLTNTVTVSSSTFDVNSANNASTINSTALAGAAVGAIAYDAGGTALTLGPIAAGSTATPPSGTFTLTNTGCLPMNLTTALFRRTGNTTNLTGLDDSRYFSLRLVPPTGAEIPLNPTPNPDRNAPQPIPINRTLQSGQSLRFRVLFNPPLPFFAGFFATRDQLLFANQVLPDLVASSVLFNFITGNPPIILDAAGDPGTVVANLTGRVSPAIQIVPRDGNAIGSSTTPLVIMETIRDDFRVRVSLYDANKNPTRITYQFFDTFRQPASNPIAVDLTSLLNSSAILPGQCFSLQQDFSGAAGRPDIVYVRVTVNDADGTTVAATSSPFLPALTAPTALPAFAGEAVRSDVITLPALRMDGSAGTRNRQTSPRSSTRGQ